MFPFHICLHARPQDVAAGETVELDGRTSATLAVEPASLVSPMSVSFEEAAESLARLPRMFVEPDGSFVWVGESAEPKWQIDGCLYDRAGSLLYVELKGSCPPAEFDLLLRAFGWPASSLIVQLVRQAVFVEEQAFRRLLETA